MLAILGADFIANCVFRRFMGLKENYTIFQHIINSVLKNNKKRIWITKSFFYSEKPKNLGKWEKITWKLRNEKIGLEVGCRFELLGIYNYWKQTTLNTDHQTIDTWSMHSRAHIQYFARSRRLDKLSRFNVTVQYLAVKAQLSTANLR